MRLDMLGNGLLDRFCCRLMRNRGVGCVLEVCEQVQWIKEVFSCYVIVIGCLISFVVVLQVCEQVQWLKEVFSPYVIVIVCSISFVVR